MKTRMLLFAVCLLWVAGVACAEFKAGAALRVVTPDPLLPLSGGLGTPGPAKEKKGDLFVRALAFEQNGVRLVIVGADFIGFPSVLGDRVRSMVKDVPAENILIGVTHTHSAPDMYIFPLDNGKFATPLEYVNFVCEKMAEAITEAVQKLEPAGLKINTDKANGKIAFNAYAERLYDPRCHVIQAVRPDGAAIATLVNYASHPEVLGPGSGILSPDFCGPLYDYIESHGGGMALYMNSAQGGMVTADNRGPDGRDIQTWEECVRIGELLASEAMRIIGPAHVQQNPELYVTAERMVFPMDNKGFQQLLEASPLEYKLNPDMTVTTQVNLINIGDAQILTIPGEALPNIGFYLKRKMKGKHNLLFGLTNDAFGYIMVKEDWQSFERYNYISRTSMSEYAGDVLVEKSVALIERNPAPAAVSAPQTAGATNG